MPANTILSHRGIENSLPWILDVSFGEDASRIRRGMAVENMIVIRHLAINWLKKEISNSYYMPRKRRKALLDDDYRKKGID